jgi:hypothetical protein
MSALVERSARNGNRRTSKRPLNYVPELARRARSPETYDERIARV